MKDGMTRREQELLAAMVQNFPGGAIPPEIQKDLIRERRGELPRLIAGGLCGMERLFWKYLFSGCQQHQRSLYFSYENFWLEPPLPDEEKWEVYSYTFRDPSDEMTVKQYLDELLDKGFRHLGGVRRAMEWIAKNPKAQLRHDIAVTALDQARKEYGTAQIPIFTVNGDKKRCVTIVLTTKNLAEISSEIKWLVLRPRMQEFEYAAFKPQDLDTAFQLCGFSTVVDSIHLRQHLTDNGFRTLVPSKARLYQYKVALPYDEILWQMLCDGYKPMLPAQLLALIYHNNYRKVGQVGTILATGAYYQKGPDKEKSCLCVGNAEYLLGLAEMPALVPAGHCIAAVPQEKNTKKK